MRMSMLLIFVGVAAINCTHPTGTGKPIPADFHLRLERTACFGFCPIYSVDVTAGGEVTYHGTMFVNDTGDRIANVSTLVVMDLANECRNIGFFALDSVYDAGVTDCPWAHVTATMDGATKRVHHYQCATAPDALRRFERMIDSVLETKRWTGQ